MKRLIFVFCFFISFSFFSQNDSLKCSYFRSLTPNGNGVDDIWKPTFSKTPQHYQLYILSNTNMVMFQTTNPDEGWDGNDMYPGVFYFIILYTDENNKLIEIRNSFWKKS